MMSRWFRFALVFLTTLLGGAAYAQQLVYVPVNPAFGGSSFNASWLLSEAQAQNGFTEPSTDQPYSLYSQDPLANFKETLSRQILSELSRQLITKTFGEGGQIKPGHFELGDFVIDITQGVDGITIEILDNVTGGQSTVFVPFF